MLNKDIIIERLMEQNQQQANHIRLLAEQARSFENKMQLLSKENQQLRDKIARLEKNSSNSSKPPSSDITNPQPENKKKRNVK